jgi:hypothetical protein
MTYLCDESTFLLSSIDVPVVSQIVAASEEVPLLSLLLKLDMAVVREILSQEEFHAPDGSSPARGITMGKTTVDLLKPFCRLLDLLDAPEDIPFLSNLIQREIVYRAVSLPQYQFAGHTTGQNIITLGDGNQIDAKFGDLGQSLAQLRTTITASIVQESTKLELVADIDTIQSQLAKPEPNPTIIKSAWEVVKGAAAINGCTALVAKVAGLLQCNTSSNSGLEATVKGRRLYHRMRSARWIAEVTVVKDRLRQLILWASQGNSPV